MTLPGTINDSISIHLHHDHREGFTRVGPCSTFGDTAPALPGSRHLYPHSLLPLTPFLHPGGHLTCDFDFGPPAAGPAGSVEAQVSCGTGPSLTGPGQAGLKGSPHSQEVPWKVPEESFGCLAAYLVSTGGRGPRDVIPSLDSPAKKGKVMGVWSFEMEQGLGVQSRRTIRQPWASLTYGNRTFFGPSSDFTAWTGLQPRSHSGVLACVGIRLARHL